MAISIATLAKPTFDGHVADCIVRELYVCRVCINAIGHCLTPCGSVSLTVASILDAFDAVVAARVCSVATARNSTC